MQKIRDILIALILSAILVGPTAILVADKLSIELPDWLTTESAQYLEGGLTDADLGSSLSISGFLSKSFQSAVEAKLSNHIPTKANAMLGNAALQRAAIATSNVLFNWECYPAFFGCKCVYIPANDAFMMIPPNKQEKYFEGLRSFTAGVADTARLNPDKTFIIFVADGYETPSSNPAYALSSNLLGFDESLEAMLGELVDDAPSNLEILTDAQSYQTTEAFFEGHFRTDHHWNIDGSINAYNILAGHLGLDKMPRGDYWELQDYAYSGSLARLSLVPATETVFDANIDYSDVSIVLSSGKTLEGNDRSDFWNRDSRERDHGFYGLYYDSLATAELRGDGDRSILLVSNSYGGSIERLLAKECKVLKRSLDLRSSYADQGQRLADEIAVADYDTVIFLGTLVDYSLLPGRLQSYF